MHRRSFFQSSAAMSMASVRAAQGTQNADADGVQEDPVLRLTQNLNPQIQHARDVALSVLKPSAAELERGLRLHADSLVFDSYGFSPRAAIDGDSMAAAIEGGSSEQELEDLQEDMTMTRYASPGNKNTRLTHLEREQKRSAVLFQA